MKKDYKVCLSIELISWRMRPSVCVFHTGTGPNLIRADVLDPALQDSIRQRDMPDIRSASNRKRNASQTITPHLPMAESRTRINFGVVNELVMPVLPGTTFIDKFIRSIHPVKRKIVAHHSSAVSILMVHEARSEADKNSTIKKTNKI